MEARRKPQLLVCLTLFSVLFSQTLAWPLLEAPFRRIPFEGANELDQTLVTLDTDIMPSALAENDRNNISENNGTIKRQSDENMTESGKLFGTKEVLDEYLGKKDELDEYLRRIGLGNKNTERKNFKGKKKQGKRRKQGKKGKQRKKGKQG